MNKEELIENLKKSIYENTETNKEILEIIESLEVDEIDDETMSSILFYLIQQDQVKQTRRVQELNAQISNSIIELSEMGKWTNLIQIVKHANLLADENIQNIVEDKNDKSLFYKLNQHRKALNWFNNLSGSEALNIYNNYVDE